MTGTPVEDDGLVGVELIVMTSATEVARFTQAKAVIDYVKANPGKDYSIHHGLQVAPWVIEELRQNWPD